MKAKMCAGIVTYNPEISKLKNNIDHIATQVDVIIVCDNGSDNIVSIQQIITDKCLLIKFSDNKGIATALNAIFETADKMQYEWVLTLDQDSVAPEGLINELSRHVRKLEVGIVAPNILYKNNEAYYKETKRTYGLEEWVITSASLTSISSWKCVNGFDEELFIDMVDYDFCIRIREAGYKIIKCYNVKLLHELGNLRCRRFLGKVVNVTNHSPFRYYYMARNNLILKKKLGVGKPVFEIGKIILKILFFEEEKGKKIKAVYKGIRTYKYYFYKNGV